MTGKRKRPSYNLDTHVVWICSGCPWGLGSRKAIGGGLGDGDSRSGHGDLAGQGQPPQDGTFHSWSLTPTVLPFPPQHTLPPWWLSGVPWGARAKPGYSRAHGLAVRLWDGKRRQVHGLIWRPEDEQHGI